MRKKLLILKNYYTNKNLFINPKLNLKNKTMNYMMKIIKYLKLFLIVGILKHVYLSIISYEFLNRQFQNKTYNNYQKK